MNTRERFRSLQRYTAETNGMYRFAANFIVDRKHERNEYGDKNVRVRSDKDKTASPNV